MEELLWTEKEAAEALRMKEEGLRGWRKQGKGPAYVRLNTHLVRYRPRDIETFIDEQAAATTKKAAK